MKKYRVECLYRTTDQIASIEPYDDYTEADSEAQAISLVIDWLIEHSDARAERVDDDCLMFFEEDEDGEDVAIEELYGFRAREWEDEDGKWWHNDTKKFEEE